MNTRDFVLVGVGAVVGYLLVGITNKNKSVLEGDYMNLPDTSSQTVPPALVGANDTSSQANLPKEQSNLVDPKLTICEDNWSNYAKTKRFGSEQQAKTTHDNFITGCLAKLQ